MKIPNGLRVIKKIGKNYFLVNDGDTEVIGMKINKKAKIGKHPDGKGKLIHVGSFNCYWLKKLIEVAEEVYGEDLREHNLQIFVFEKNKLLNVGVLGDLMIAPRIKVD